MKEVQYINPNLFSSQDAWGKLSLAEKSAMIEAGVANGLTQLSDIKERYNSFAMGGEEETLDDYLQAKRDSIIDSALDMSRTRTMPEKIDIQIPITEDEREQLPFMINQFEQELKAMNHIAGSPYLGNSDLYGTQNYPYTSTYNSRHSGRYKDYANEINENSEAGDVDYYQDYLAWYRNSGPIELAVNKRYTEEALQDAKNVLRQGYRLGPGFTCLNTATNNYGREHQESSNVAFADNPNKYGFIEVNYNDKQPGDIVQINKESVYGLVPTHAILFNGLDEDGIATFNYSSGGNDQRSYKTNRRYPDADLENAKAYRFVGNPQDIEDWTQEYYNSHSLGGPLVQQANLFGPGGPKKSLLDRFAQATIQAEMNANPAIMTAAGWKYDSNGNLVQKPDDGSQRLAENLAQIAYIPLSELGLGLAAEAVGPYAMAVAKNIKPAIKSGQPLKWLWNNGKVLNASIPKEAVSNSKQFYRVVSDVEHKGAIYDAQKTGIIRAGENSIYKSPMFRKGEPFWSTEGPKFNESKKAIIVSNPNSELNWTAVDYMGEALDPSSQRIRDALGHVPTMEELIHTNNNVATPLYNGIINSAPASEFSYWRNYPFLGWRILNF